MGPNFKPRARTIGCTSSPRACRCLVRVLDVRVLDVMGAWRRIDGGREHAVFDGTVPWRRGCCQRDEALNCQVWLQPAELAHMSEGQVQIRMCSGFLQALLVQLPGPVR